MKPALQSLFTVHDATRIAIHRNSEESPILVQQSEPGKRAFIHPIRAPDGHGTLTENAPQHHPWQHGLYVGLNEVNGIGFWTEGLIPQPHRDGSFHPRPLSAPKVEENHCTWSVISDWRAHDHSDVLVETQKWRITDLGDHYELDLTWTLLAVIDLEFGQYPYGGLFVRMPFAEVGTVLTSEGHQTHESAEGQRARWVAIAMPLPDRHGADPWAGMAIMDHPDNPQHPVPWRVDCQLGISPSRCIAGVWTLAAGATSISRHRVFIHPGPTDASAVEASWSHFIK